MSALLPASELPRDHLGPLHPLRVLYEFDGPRIFVTSESTGHLLLAYLSAEEGEERQFLLVPFSAAEEGRLVRGLVSVRDALAKPWAWLATLGPDDEVLRLGSVEVSALPADALPRPGTMLWPQLQPLLTVKVLGNELEQGDLPGSVIRAAIANAEKALKTLLDFRFELRGGGRPPDRLRRFYDLPAQQLAFGSFEIAFGPPREEPQLALDLQAPEREGAEREDEEVSTLRSVGAALRTGLAWASSPAGEDLAHLAESDEARLVVLQAVRCLTPPRHGRVTRMEIGGVLVERIPGRTVALTVDSRVRIDAGLKRLNDRPAEIVKVEGHVREVDRDACSFRLVDADGNATNFVYGDEHLDDLLEFFNDEASVRVVGRKQRSSAAFEVVLLEPSPS